MGQVIDASSGLVQIGVDEANGLPNEIVLPGGRSARLVSTFPNKSSLPSPSNFGVGVAQVGSDLYVSDGNRFVSLNNYVDKSLINVNSLQIDKNISTLTLPALYSPNDWVYLMPIFVDSGWNGYKWWAVGAPYPASSGAFENPCILVSTDGISWTQPAGITNPIISAPASGKNAEPILFFSPDYTKLYCAYVWKNAGTSIPGGYNSGVFITESTNGINWSSPILVVGTLTASNDSLDSPSILWNGNGWTMLSGTTVSPAPGILRRTTTSATPYSGWSAGSSITIKHPAAGTWWRHTFYKQYDGSVIGLATDGNNSGGSIYVVNSSDEINYTSKQLTIGGNYYRASFAYVQGKIISYLSRLGGFEKTRLGLSWVVQMLELNLNGLSNNSANYNFRTFVDMIGVVSGFSIQPSKSVIAYDSFNRTDNPAGLGTSDSGHTWTNQLGIIGIQTNKAYLPTIATNSQATIDPVAQNCVIEAKFGAGSLASNGYWMVFRHQNSSNYWRFGSNGTSITIQKIIGGSAAINYSVAVSIAPNTVVSIQLFNGFILIFLNDVMFDFLYDTQLIQYTACGLQASGTTQPLFDNFIVRDIS